MKTKTSLFALPCALVLSLASAACPSSGDETTPPAPGGSSQPERVRVDDDGGSDDSKAPGAPSQAALSACSSLLDAYESECSHALDTTLKGGACGTGYEYVPACEDELIEFLACMSGSPFDCYDQEYIVLPYECDNTGWSFKHCVDPSLPALKRDEPEEVSEAAPKCTGSAYACSSYSPGSCPFGCRVSLGSTLGTYDDECAGTPEACEDILSREFCEEQGGCTWEP